MNRTDPFRRIQIREAVLVCAKRSQADRDDFFCHTHVVSSWFFFFLRVRKQDTPHTRSPGCVGVK